MNRALIVVACLSIVVGCSEQPKNETADRERRNIQIVNAHMEAFFRGDTATVVSMYAEDAVIIPYMSPGVQFGRDEFVSTLYKEFIMAFPGSVSTIEGEFAKGDLVCIRRVTRGMHTGPFMGMPPTNKPTEVHACHVLRIVDGKIKNHWIYWDMAGLLNQLGMMPKLPMPEVQRK